MNFVNVQNERVVTVNVRGVNHAPYFDVPTYQVSIKDVSYDFFYFTNKFKNLDMLNISKANCLS